MISHMSPEPGHLRLAVALRKVPIIDLKMRLGEASGAAVASLLVRAACAMHNGMAQAARPEIICFWGVVPPIYPPFASRRAPRGSIQPIEPSSRIWTTFKPK